MPFRERIGVSFRMTNPKPDAQNLAFLPARNLAENVCGDGDWSSDSNRDTTFSGQRTEPYRDENVEIGLCARAFQHGKVHTRNFTGKYSNGLTRASVAVTQPSPIP